MHATPEEAARVVADLTAKAKALQDTRAGRRAAINLLTAASTVELIYGIGTFSDMDGQ